MIAYMDLNVNVATSDIQIERTQIIHMATLVRYRYLFHRPSLKAQCLFCDALYSPSPPMSISNFVKPKINLPLIQPLPLCFYLILLSV